MDVTELRHCINQLNSEELFYKEQYEARQSGQIHAYIARQNIKEITKRHLLIPEVPETIPPEFLDSFLYDVNDKDRNEVLKHNLVSIQIPNYEFLSKQLFSCYFPMLLITLCPNFMTVLLLISCCVEVRFTVCFIIF